MRGAVSSANHAYASELLRSISPQVSHLNIHDQVAIFSAASDTSQPPRSLHLLRSRSSPSSVKNNNDLKGPVLCSYGQADRRVEAPFVRQPVTKVNMDEDAEVLLKQIGCSLEYKYIKKGLRVITRKGIRIDLFAILKWKEKEKKESQLTVENEKDIGLGEDGKVDTYVVEAQTETGGVEELKEIVKMLNGVALFPGKKDS